VYNNLLEDNHSVFTTLNCLHTYITICFRYVQNVSNVRVAVPQLQELQAMPPGHMTSNYVMFVGNLWIRVKSLYFMKYFQYI